MRLQQESCRSLQAPQAPMRQSQAVLADAVATGQSPASSTGADCLLLLAAVKQRLQDCTSGDWMEGGVLECVSALEQLQSMLAPVNAGYEALDAEVAQIRAALGSARAELLTAQAGERLARRLAMHDGLTLLPNRLYFVETLGSALRQLPAGAQTLAVLYLDLDGFKSINDLHGHEAGDEMLRITGIRLSRAVRAEDMVSRLGGDEFACLLPGPVNRGQLIRLAGKLFDAISAPMKIGPQTCTICPSIGIAIYPEDGNSASELLKSADAAMYTAKRLQTRHAFHGAAGPEGG